jgi:hypothetical protein
VRDGIETGSRGERECDERVEQHRCLRVGVDTLDTVPYERLDARIRKKVAVTKV